MNPLGLFLSWETVFQEKTFQLLEQEFRQGSTFLKRFSQKNLANCFHAECEWEILWQNLCIKSKSPVLECILLKRRFSCPISLNAQFMNHESGYMIILSLFNFPILKSSHSIQDLNGGHHNKTARWLGLFNWQGLKILSYTPTGQTSQTFSQHVSIEFPSFGVFEGMLELWFYFVFHTGVEFHHVSPTLQGWNVRFWKDSPSNPLPKLLEIPSPKMGPFRKPFQLGSRIFKHWASLSNSTWHVALRMAFVGTLILKCVAESQGMSTCQVLVKKAKANLFQTHVFEKDKK